jgi:hypothetical protein
VFENRVLRGIFGTKREKVAEGWRTLHNEGLYKLYTSSNRLKISRRIRYIG